MKKSNLTLLVFIGVLLTVSVALLLYSSSFPKQLNTAASGQENSLDKLLVSKTDTEASGKSVDISLVSTDLKLWESEDLIDYQTSDLEAHWEEDLGCYNLVDANSLQCDYPELTASSYEDAVWMIGHGYPPASILREMEALSDEELKLISRNRQYWLPALILAQRYANSGDSLTSFKYFLRSHHRNMNPYGLIRHGMSLIQNADPESPGWSNRNAAVQFKKAALLGDSMAQQLLYELYESYWGGRPGIVIVTDVTETALWELSGYFDLPRQQWPVVKRPEGG